MASEWRTYTFEELIENGSLLIGDGYRAKNEELGGDGHIFLRAGHVTDTHIDLTGAERFHESLSDRLTSKMAKAGDVVITTKGNSTGRTSYITADLPPLVYSPHLSFWRSTNYNVIVPEFLRYWARSQQFQSQLEGFKVSTDMAPYLSLVDQKRLRISLPSSADQRGIAEILSALDDKIELNRRMNTTLEAMAQAIFKSWFVDFDPVKAKSAGRTPEGIDADTAALFPGEFQDSEVGPIPKGWQRRLFPECIDFLEGPGIRNWQYTNTEEGTRFINIRCIKDGDIVLDTASRIKNEEANGKYRHFLLKAGDLIVSTSGTLGRFSIVRQEHLPLMLNTSVIRMRPVPNITSHEYVYGYIASEEFQREIHTRASGSVQKNFGPMHLKQMNVLLPNFQLIQAHTRLSKPIFDRFMQNRTENVTLKELRDSLISKLMSIQLQIPDQQD